MVFREGRTSCLLGTFLSSTGKDTGTTKKYCECGSRIGSFETRLLQSPEANDLDEGECGGFYFHINGINFFLFVSATAKILFLGGT